MRRILYISTARVEMSPSDIISVLDASRRNNARDGITGLLIAGGKRFLQALEGSEDEVRNTFDRIARDDRHSAIVKLNDGSIDRRSFSGWAMGFMQGNDSASRTVSGQVADIVAGLDDPNLRAYFTGFVETHRAA